MNKRIIKVDHPYSERVTEILHEGRELLTKVGHVNGQQSIEDAIRLLDAAKSHAERVQENFKALDKRGNQILRLVMKECGVEGRWKMEFDPRQSIISTLMPRGVMCFSLSVPASFRWKSRFRECPVYKVLPMEMPIVWLDMTSQQLRQEIQQRLS